MTFHAIAPRLLQDKVRIALVGAGGNGSQMLTGLARLDRAIRALGHPGGLDVIVYDPDKVSEANVGRQLFSAADIGAFKAFVLVDRLNRFFGIDWGAVPELYKRDLYDSPDILITCVDTAKARREIYTMYQNLNGVMPSYWLDMGNGAQDGQVVLGQFWCPDRRSMLDQNTSPRPAILPNVMDIFPELLDEGFVEDDTPSCSLAEALEKQGLYINQAVSTQALILLEQLFRNGGIERHGCVLNLTTGDLNHFEVPEPKQANAVRIQVHV